MINVLEQQFAVQWCGEGCRYTRTKETKLFYFSQSIPSDLQHRFIKRKIGLSLRTKSESKAAKFAATLSDRLKQYRAN